MGQLESLIASCGGKDPSQDEEEHQKLHRVYDSFSANLDMIQDFWGHRLEAAHVMR